jgi:hypothetical protein
LQKVKSPEQKQRGDGFSGDSHQHPNPD